jgi:DNA-binding response OmpR family regulator
MTRALVVDDEYAIVEALEALLTDEGYAVVVAKDGVEGLEKLRHERPDFALIDLMMPVMSGEEMLEKMRAEPSFPTCPVILMSAARREDLVATLGVAAFLRKPFGIDELLATIEHVLDGKPAG